MKKLSYIPVDTLCTHYQIEHSFVMHLSNMELIEVQTIDQAYCIHEEQLGHLERIIRLQQDLNIDLDSLDVVLHLVQKVESLQQELSEARSRLRWFELE